MPLCESCGRAFNETARHRKRPRQITHDILLLIHRELLLLNKNRRALSRDPPQAPDPQGPDAPEAGTQPKAQVKNKRNRPRCNQAFKAGDAVVYKSKICTVKNAPADKRCNVTLTCNGQEFTAKQHMIQRQTTCDRWSPAVTVNVGDTVRVRSTQEVFEVKDVTRLAGVTPDYKVFYPLDELEVQTPA